MTISFPVTSVMARRVCERGSHECMSETHLTDFLPGNSSDKTIAATTLQAKEQRLRIPGEKSVGHPIVSVAWNIVFIFFPTNSLVSLQKMCFATTCDRLGFM